MILFALISFSFVVSFFSIAFFIWNFYNRNAFPRQSFVFFSIAIALNIYYFAELKPWGDKIQKEWDTPGYDKSYTHLSQTFLNTIARQVEAYKKEKGSYPNSLDNLYELDDRWILNIDYSYRAVMEDGQVDGISFYYNKVNRDSFYLSAVGPDGLGKSPDDIIPEIYHYEEKNSGLTKYKLLPISKRDLKRGYSDSTIGPNTIILH